MAYSPHGLKLVVESEDRSFRLWHYTSTDAVTAVRVAGYFADGGIRGMQVGDCVIVLDNNASPITGALCWVTSLTSGAADLSDGVTITGTDSD